MVSFLVPIDIKRSRAPNGEGLSIYESNGSGVEPIRRPRHRIETSSFNGNCRLRIREIKERETYIMADFTVGEMQDMQKALQEKYRHKWEPICPEVGQNKLLWMVGEIGEVIDIIAKNGGRNAAENQELRKDLVEEMADALMYYNDVMLCYGISVDELKRAYTEKFKKNMKRW